MSKRVNHYHYNGHRKDEEKFYVLGVILLLCVICLPVGLCALFGWLIQS